MVGEGIEGDLGGRMVDMFSGIRNFKVNESPSFKTCSVQSSKSGLLQ